ncbi:BrnT family toxin [Marinobacter sp. LM1]|jgi:uncharacterized DUF497 family protein|uniref:BrnT family toxin n=1 Tax=Marinobacter sp. LM1 TaxID=3003349 RepID=UPI001A10B89C|nr:BrnT family toxin [Alphaproteobacteria bacterium]
MPEAGFALQSILAGVHNDYGERRMIGYGPIGDRVYCVVYTERKGIRRIISLRKANRREVRLYADNI